MFRKVWFLDINDGLEAVDSYVIAIRQFRVSEVWSYQPSSNCWSRQMKHSFPASSVQHRCHINHHKMNLSKCLPHVLYGHPSWCISITSIGTYRGYPYLSRSPLFFLTEFISSARLRIGKNKYDLPSDRIWNYALFYRRNHRDKQSLTAKLY